MAMQEQISKSYNWQAYQILQMELSTREYENLRRELVSLLRDFEKNKQWADFNSWLHRLLEAISDKKSSSLPEQLNICKRLAQCLNPSLPTGVHSIALKAYEAVLHNFGPKTQLLPLIAMGLLPFFEHSNIQNKFTVLKIFQDNFVTSSEGVQMIVGLSNALLTVFNETSEQLSKRAYSIFDKVSKNYGRLWVDGAVWVNILKSPKVRLAGFKYFTKAFRERDKIVQSQEKLLEERQVLEVAMIERSIDQSELSEEEKVLLTTLYGFKGRPDNNATRFPNFSSLVVNSLSVCLEISADSMIKRAALDLIGGYLKLGSGVFGQREGIVLLEKMLILLQSKEYSQTNRVYKYLFDQPNSEGFFNIELDKKQYQLQILKQALRNLLANQGEQSSTESGNALLIMEILIGDHPVLAEFLLEGLALEILTFAQNEQSKQKNKSALTKAVTDFFLNVVLQYRSRFISSLLKKIRFSTEIDPLTPGFSVVLEALKFYFGKMEKLTVEPKRKNSDDSNDQKLDEARQKADYLLIRVQTLSQLIEYLWANRPLDEQLSIKILDLSNQLLAEIQIFCQTKDQGLSFKEIQKIETLLAQEEEMKRRNLYAKLLTLHPQPKKEMLLPYIEDNSLSIVCINLVLGGDKISADSLRPRALSTSRAKLQSSTARSVSLPQMFGSPLSLTSNQQQKMFYAIFKLLNCHLFEVRSLEFIQRYRFWWEDLFVQLIDKVEPSEWLIYWKKKEGDVAGGILRMIDNLNSQNSYHKHLSKVWIGEAENIISKVLDAIYRLFMDSSDRKDSIDEEGTSSQFKVWNIAAYDRVFNLLQLVFKYTSSGFCKFFFLQKDKYVIPLVLFIFKCLENDSFEIKSRSLSMLSFIFCQADLPQEKIDFLGLTLTNIMAILSQIIDAKKKLNLESHENAQETLQLSSNFEIELLDYTSLSIKRANEIAHGDIMLDESIVNYMKKANIYDVMLKGIIFTDTHYIKNLYIDSSKELSEMIAKRDRSKTEITVFITSILDKLFILLKNSDANRIQVNVKRKNEPNLKESLEKTGSFKQNQIVDTLSFFPTETHPEKQVKENLNLEDKYAEIVELWNTVKYYLQFALRLELRQMPIINLLSLALNSFPLGFLEYTTVGSPQHTANIEALEQQVSNVTGLKKQIFQIFQILWNKESRQIVDFLVEKRDPRILIHSHLDPSKVLQAINRSLKMKEVQKHLKGDKLSLPKNMLYYNGHRLMVENQLLFFIYLYLLYCNFRLLRGKQIASFFDALLQCLNLLKISSHVQTKLWLLELMELIGQRISSIKQLNIGNGAEIRNELQHITKNLLEEVLAVITKSKQFTHRTEVKTGLFNIFSKQEKEKGFYDFLKVFPPTISEQCERYQKYKDGLKKSYETKKKFDDQDKEKQNKKMNPEHPKSRLTSYLLDLDTMTSQHQNPIDNFLFTRFVNIPEADFPDYLSICGLRTLIRIGNSILINLFDKDLGRVSMIIKEILLSLLPICQNRDPSNQYFNELIGQYLHVVLTNQQLRPEILKNLRKNIIEVYMTNNFFKCTPKTLTHWKAVIDYSTNENNDLLGELLSREGLFEGIFTKKAEATRQKIKSFERVCFLIYAGQVDRYEHKLRIVLESLNEVMKQEDAPPALIILILFCIRILLLRLSAISLNKLFKSVWPSLITLLIQIFKSKNGLRSINLQLAALKVIELIHAMELEQFMLHKWMFIFDYFGLKIDPMGEINDNMHNCEMHSPFTFKPFMTNALPCNRLRCKFVPEKMDYPVNGLVKRRLIVKKTYVESEEDLRENALLLMQYMMELNECRCEISKDDIESLIEDEFVSLDDYIFKVK